MGSYWLLNQYLGDEIKRSQPHGGMFMWVEFAGKIDALRLFSEVSARDVLYIVASS